MVELAQLAYEHPELRATLAANPSSYEGLLQWLEALGDPEVAKALAGRDLPPWGQVSAEGATQETEAPTSSTIPSKHPLSPRTKFISGAVVAAIVLAGAGAALAVATTQNARIAQREQLAAQQDHSDAADDDRAAGAAQTQTPTQTAIPTPEAPLPPSVPVFAPQDPAAFPSALGPDGVEFDSPSGNIHCGIYLSGGTLDYFGCAIDEYDWEDPTPTGAALECSQMIHYGGGFIVPADGPTGVLCRGGVMFGGEIQPVAVLPYGTSVTYAGVTCESSESGVNCRGLVTGSGFELSSSEYSVF